MRKPTDADIARFDRGVEAALSQLAANRRDPRAPTPTEIHQHQWLREREMRRYEARQAERPFALD